MNYYVAIPFFAVLVNIVSTTYIFAQNRKDPVNEAYIWLSVFFIGWMFFDIIHWSPINPHWIVPLLRAQSFFWLLSGFMFTHFTYTFFQRERDIAYYVILVVAMASVPVALTSELVIKGYVSEVWGTAIRPGILYVPMASLVVLTPFVYSLFLFLLNMLKSDDAVKRNQCRLVLSGTAVAVGLTFVTVIILPHFLGFPALPQTHLAIMIHLLFVFAAIVKYKFLAIGIRDAAQDIFSSVRDGVVLLNKINEVIQVNESARKILDIEGEGDSQKVIDRFLGSNLAEKNIDEYETELKIGDFSKALMVSRSPLRQAGSEVGSILFIRDITSKKHAEYEVRRINADLAKARDRALAASKAKSQFLANMSHELRTPLNAIIGYSEILREEAAEIRNKILAADLEKIHGAGLHLLTLINDILDLSKIEAGRMEVFPEQAGVATLVNEVIEIVSPMMLKNANVFEVNGLEKSGVICTDVTKIRQVLFNLLSNASKFTSNGKVRLEIERLRTVEREEILFRVTDTGIGMTSAQVEGLFEYFSQADPSTTRKYGGTGLGLAISQRFCLLLGGTISVTSTEGAGSIFEIRIPAIIDSAAAANHYGGQAVEIMNQGSKPGAGLSAISGPVAGSRSAGVQTVLVIDDDPAVRDLLGGYLEREGFDVIAAENGQEGIYKAETESPDMVILDVMLPGTDGWSILEHLKISPRLSVIPVIMLNMAEDGSGGYALGAINFLSKPVDRSKLLYLIKNAPGVNGSAVQSVLVVDDDPDNRRTVKISLEMEGCQVEEAENGETAMRCLDRNLPSIVLLDIMRPEMDGFEFIDEFRKNPQFRTIPVVVLTEMDIDPAARNRLKEQLLNVMLRGACSQEQLLSRISRIISGQDRALADSGYLN